MKDESVLGWIPQVFYDLIGRLTPGAFVLLCYFELFESPEDKNALIVFVFRDSGIPSSVTLLIALLFSYLCGLLLGAVGFFIKYKEWKTRPPLLSVRYRPDLKKPEILEACMYDAVQHDATGGPRLAKLMAEQHMCRVLIIGFSAMGIIHVAAHFAAIQSTSFWVQSGLLAAVIAVSWILHRHLNTRAKRLLSNEWYLLALAERYKLAVTAPDSQIRIAKRMRASRQAMAVLGESVKDLVETGRER